MLLFSEPPFYRAAHLDGLGPCELARSLNHLPGLAFFDSAGNLPSSAPPAISIVVACPREILTGSIHERSDCESLRRKLAEPSPGEANAAGGLFGWVDYEGQFVFGDYHDGLVYSHRDRQWWEMGQLSSKRIDPPSSLWPAKIGHFTSSTDRAWFIERVVRAKELIAAGDIYQVNLAQQFVAPVQTGSLWPLYEHLRRVSPAPMAGYLKLAKREILSSSPELFLRIADGKIETRPIKGTRPRFSDPAADRHSAAELQSSPKETAELIMITDLLRNDLGQVCKFGSVTVAELLRLESLGQVHHLVSTVTGSLRPDTDALEALAQCFPGGSITGAPKKRAMEVITTLEASPRDLYCGAIGWLARDGSGCFNLAIRTLVRENQTLSYRVGAGIVADSDPAMEYQETLDKAAGIKLAINQFCGAFDR